MPRRSRKAAEAAHEPAAMIRRAPRAAWLPWVMVEAPLLPHLTLMADSTPAPTVLDAPLRVGRRQRALPPPSLRLGEGHLLFRQLRNPWRAHQRQCRVMGWGADPRQHNHRPCQDMRWWPR